MVIPILNGLVSFFKAPITWSILILNLMMLLLTQNEARTINAMVSDLFQDKDMIKVQASNFSQYVVENQRSYSNLTVKLSKQVLGGDLEPIGIVAGIATSDSSFAANFKVQKFYGDQIAISIWKNKFDEILKKKSENINYKLGLTKENFNWMTPITYQFVHSDFNHLLSNGIFLLIFGSALEAQIGSFMFLLMYLAMGYVAALFFALFAILNMAPLVGASGAISGIMAFYCLKNINIPIRYFWVVGFSKGYHGIIYLPAWIAFVMWFVADLAGFLSSIEGISSVAFLAHLGGELAGALCAFAILALSFTNELFFGSKSTT